MIIVQDSSDLKSPQARLDTPRPLPNGHLGSAHPQSLHPYSSSYHTTPLLPPPPPPSYPNPPITWHVSPPSAPKRFLKAFALALLIYITLFAFARAVVHMASRTIWDDGPAGIPRAEDGTVLESVGGHGWTHHRTPPHWAPAFSESAEKSFTLPVSAETLYLISRGSYQTGTVKVKQGTEQGGEVRVDLRVAYDNDRALARATLCRLRKGGNKHGVGIYTPLPEWPDIRDRLYFEVVFTFPTAPSERSPLRINEFTTHTRNFAHEIGDLWQSLVFGNMELDTSNAAIRAKSITLTRGTLVSNNGAIVGHFNTSDALILRTSNAHIEATASLYNTPGRGATQLEMWTSNARITSSVSLATASGSGGNFTVTARSSNGGIALQYDDAPTGSHLVSEVRTSNAGASVVMHPTFEGRYEVSTSNSRAVMRDTHPEDPLQKGRRRVVQERASGNMVSGRVYWAEGDGRRGGVEGLTTVHTSNSRASLDL